MVLIGNKSDNKGKSSDIRTIYSENDFDLVLSEKINFKFGNI